MIAVNQERLVRQFMDFVQIDSPTFEEAGFVLALEKELQSLGLSVENDRTGQKGAGNLFAPVPATNPVLPSILLCMHTDTVEPGRGIKPRLGGDRICSDGSTILGADNKAPISATIEAIRWLNSARPGHGDIEFLFTWGEERGHLGMKAFDVSRLRARIGFVPDGGGPLGTIITRAPYHDGIKATFVGKAAHAGVSPELGISAIVMASRAISRMNLGRVSGETTANVGKISGGSGHNIIPERVEIIGEARSLVREHLENQVRQMRIAMEDSAREAGGKVQLDIEREYDGYHIGDDEIPVRIASEASKAVGLAPTITSTNGGSDANDLNAKGIRTVVLGMAGRDYHTTQESIAVDELVKLAEWIAAVIMEAGRQQ
jgi:tripeptide aminopeptidase